MQFTLHDSFGPRQVEFSAADLVIAGWTGRDQAALNAHIKELGAMGIRSPSRTPMFYRLGASLLTTACGVEVIGKDSSGEVEFVLFQIGDELCIGLGSDHTDRKAEAAGIALSKQLCPKPVASELWALADVEPHWDELILRAYAVTEGKRALYQEGKVDKMCHPRNLMELYAQRNPPGFGPGTVMFGGTLAAIGGIRWADRFEMELEDPVLERRITHGYDIRALPIEG